MKQRSSMCFFRIPALVLAMFVLIQAAVSVSAFAAESPETDTAFDWTGDLPEDQLPETYEEAEEEYTPVVFSDEKQLTNIEQIRVPFPHVDEKILEWDFPYSDEFFSIPSGEFSITTARGSMGLTLSAFRSGTGSQYTAYLSGAGFTDIYGFGYDQPTYGDSLSGVIGMKRIGDCTVIAVAACGQGYGNEWASNFKVGTGVRHEGFNKSAQLFENHLTQYMDNHGIEGRIKLWVTGFSRASAVGNILAADMIESGRFEDVYAYLFGVPRTTKQPVRYKGIYNICGQYDPVPSVPLPSLGYERYGTDLYTPTQEADAEYTKFAYAAKAVGTQLDGKGFRNNPEINYQLRLMLESFGEFFPDSEDYCERMQGLLEEAVLSNSEDHVFELLTQAFAQLEPEKTQDRGKIDTFMDYVSYVAGQHLRADQRQLLDGSWDPDETLAANVALEHLPVTYVRWLFAEEEPQKIFAGCSISRRISLLGQFDVTVLKDGQEITSIDKYGKLTYPLEKGSDGTSRDPGVFMMRNENVTIICLPNDAEYYVRVDADSRCTVTYYDLIVSPERLSTEAGKINLGTMADGSYGLKAVPGEELPTSLEEIEGSYTFLGSSDYEYSPAAVMNDELEATKHYFMSLRRVYRIVVIAAVSLVLLLLGCLLTNLVHRGRVKKGHPPFSKWFVIVPYLVTISGLTFLTGLVTYHLFAIDLVRIVCASFTVLAIFLLSLRGTLRYRRNGSILLTTVLFVLFAVTFLFFKRAEKLPFSWGAMTLFAIVVGILTLLAVRTFREPPKEA